MSQPNPTRSRRPKTPIGSAEPQPAVPTVPATAAVDLDLLEDSLGFLLKRAQMAVFHDFIRTFVPEDIRPAQFSVLIVIERNPGLKQSQVSEVLSIKRTNFVPLLDGLEARGLVKRKPAPTDRRSHALHLTAKGRALVIRLRALWAEHNARACGVIGPEGSAYLFGVLSRLVELGGESSGDEETDAPETEPVPRRAVRGRARSATADRVSAAEDEAPRQAGSPRR